MKATDVVKSWKDLSGFIYDVVSGANKNDFSNDDWEMIDQKGTELMKDLGLDEIYSKAKKIMNLNILDRKVSFDVFEKVPNIWQHYCGIAIDVVASECGQSIMARGGSDSDDEDESDEEE